MLQSNVSDRKRKSSSTSYSSSSSSYAAAVKLSFLPLRPSTLSILTRRGFHTCSDVFASKTSGGISNFAAELDVDLMEATGIHREVESAVRTYYNCRRCISNNNNNNNNDNNLTDPSPQDGPVRNNGPLTAASILSLQYSSQSERLKSRPIITFAQAVDSLLGGGVQPKEVTEIVGSPGVGKTQLAMQLCVDAHLPIAFGGVDGDSIYIDTEGSFSPERCWDMAKALYDHLQGSVRRSGGKKQLPENFSVESILDSIHVFRVLDETSQNCTIQSLPDFIEKKKEMGRCVKLLVMDSIAFHYRVNASDKSRTKSLARIASMLADMAVKYDMAVVVINQMTMKLQGLLSGGGGEVGSGGGSSGGGGMEEESWMESRTNTTNTTTATTSSVLVPALGESWAHAMTTRLWLSFVSDSNPQRSRISGSGGSGDGKRRLCRLVKSPHKPEGTAVFTITKYGIRGDVSSPH
jgi:RecA/RadA recombinase